VDHPEPVIVTGVSEAGRTALALMDGTITLEQLLEPFELPARHEVRDLLARLAAAGAVIDAGRWPGGRGVPAARRERLMADLTATAPADPDLWWRSLSRTHVTVVGASRLGAITARALAESGFASVTVDDSRPVTSADVVLGGFTPDDVGSSRADLLRSHPGPPAERARPHCDREVAVLTDAVDIDSRAKDLAAIGVPYLVVACRERSGRVGPFVQPGLTACHFCVELHQRDVDPDWPDVWRQRTWDASPVAQSHAAAVTAHTAAAHVVAYALGRPVPSALGVVSIDLDRAASPFRATPPHPECGCTWTPMAS
jgi:hypothetical protein